MTIPSYRRIRALYRGISHLLWLFFSYAATTRTSRATKSIMTNRATRHEVSTPWTPDSGGPPSSVASDPTLVWDETFLILESFIETESLAKVTELALRLYEVMAALREEAGPVSGVRSADRANISTLPAKGK